MTCILLVCIVLAQIILENQFQEQFIYYNVFTGGGGFQSISRCGYLYHHKGTMVYISCNSFHLLCDLADGMLKCVRRCHSQARG
ncbi:hypothetical protein M758_8G081100 [Ceratodon purpureus]|nr:hypothetical protein M758_8G081100 [Ceratodon purpureus]